MRVLVVHRDADVRSGIRAAVEQTGARVGEFAAAAPALAATRDTRPEVVVAEMALIEDGTDLLDAIRRDPDLLGTSVVMVTPDLDLDAAVHALARGAHDVLLEPPVVAEVVARVQAAERAGALRVQLLARERGLEELAFSDDLTRVFNRRYLDRQLSALVSSAARHGRRLGLVLLDLDCFKEINDRHGHAAGDAVLVEVAARLRGALRAEDVAGRWGGEEFLVLLPDVGEDGARVTAEKLRAAVAGTPVAGLAVTLSAGCAAWHDGEAPEALVRRADDALYAAKRGGRDQVRSAA